MELQNESIFPANPQIDDEYVYLFWLVIGGYLVLVAVLTYFLFFFKKGRLIPEKGPKSASEEVLIPPLPQDGSAGSGGIR